MSDLHALHQDVGEVKGKLDFLIGLVKQHCNDDKTIQAALDARLRALEDQRNEKKGRDGVISAAVSFVVSAATAVAAKIFV